MKRISLTLFLATLTFSFSYAQWTTSSSNIYNSNTGYVGIGTTAPGYQLSVVGNYIKSSNSDLYSGISIGGEATNRPIIGFHVSDNSRRFKMELNDVNTSNERVGIFTTAGGAWPETEVFSINKIGYVGIGTISPTAPLNIFASGALTDLYPEQLTIGSSVPYNASPVASMLFTTPYNSSGTNAGLAQIAVGKENNGNGDLASFMAFSTRASAGSVADRMRITSTGNVGIGTSSPQNRLDVQGGNATVYNNGTATIFGVGSTLAGKTFLQLSTSGDVNGYGIIQTVASQGVAMGNTVINPSAGNVLIGKTSQVNTGYILDVNGNVRANQVVINSTGADFVFAPTYHLNSLANVKKYIDKNHHLPEIASAKEMQTNGLNVGENQTKLLQKVEELTLYLIQKDKKIKEQETINSNQKQINQSLQKELDEIKSQLSTLIKNKK